MDHRTAASHAAVRTISSETADQDEAIEEIATTWFWIAVALFLVLQFGDSIRVHGALGLLIAGEPAIVNVAVFFGLVCVRSAKLGFRSNLLWATVEPMIATMATLGVAALFLPVHFKGVGDFLIGAAGLVILIEAALGFGGLYRLPVHHRTAAWPPKALEWEVAAPDATRARSADRNPE